MVIELMEDIHTPSNGLLELYDEFHADSYQFPAVLDNDENDEEFDLSDIHLTEQRGQTIANGSFPNTFTTYF